MRRLAPIHDERGLTLVELIVAMAAGMIVFAGLTTMVIASLHQSTRVTRRVHATQEARLTVHRIVTELHSSCVAAEVAPIHAKQAAAPRLSFVYQTGSAAALTPVLHKVFLTGTTSNCPTYPSTSGSTPEWTFSTTAVLDHDADDQRQRRVRQQAALHLLQIRQRRDLLDAPVGAADRSRRRCWRYRSTSPSR